MMDDLDDLFASARQDALHPSAALMARVLADAAREQPRPAVRIAPKLSFWAALAALAIAALGTAFGAAFWRAFGAGRAGIVATGVTATALRTLTALWACFGAGFDGALVFFHFLDWRRHRLGCWRFRGGEQALEPAKQAFFSRFRGWHGLGRRGRFRGGNRG